MNDFKQLISAIEQIHNKLQTTAANAVNQTLTIRNWLIGYYIVEFEQNGKDRAEYGKSLLKSISQKIKIKGLTAPELSRCRQFYKNYPQIFGTVSQKLKTFFPNEILGTASQKSELHLTQLQNKEIRDSVSPELKTNLQVPADKLLAKLSFSHFVELIKVDNALKRTFYELECIKGTWSVRELKRQINSLYFERSGLSENPGKLAELVKVKTEPQAPKDIIKNIYAFEFLELPTQSIIEESDLETALLNHLQKFIIELGNGFCFEARQKRIIIGEKYYFIDLVFYHRILKCHILIELKIGEFEHGDIGQLNTYLNYFKSEICENSDNPPVGILLVAEKDNTLVEYATAGMDKNLFIQKYMLQLPSVEQLKTYMEKELNELR